MPSDEFYVLAQGQLDEAEKQLTAAGSRASIEARAQVAIGWAILALQDEVHKLAERLPSTD